MLSNPGCARVAALAVVMVWAASPSVASAQSPTQTYTYEVLVDADRDPGTGCSVTPSAGPTLTGFEHRLTATVVIGDGNDAVTAVERRECTGAAFGAPVPVTPPSPPWPVNFDGGVSGSDALELAVPRADVVDSISGSLALTFVADSGGGSDVLATVDGSPSGPPIVISFAQPPVNIPVLSLWGLAVLLVAIAGLAWLAHRRFGRIGAAIMVMLVATAAWAMNFAADGDLSDWTGLAPAGQDPTGDATDGLQAIDLVAAFAAFENDTLFLRVDLAEIENQAPVANDDAFSVDEDTALSEPAAGVLANDTDGDTDPLTATLVTGPANAQAFTLDADGSFDYTPAADFSGSDGFTYVANDGQVDSAPATVTITVNPINDPPVAVDDTALTNEDVQVDIDVLANDSDVDGNLDPASMAVTTPPAAGVTSVNPANGVITYTKSADFNGADSFVYEVCDDGTPLPAECASATVTITVNSVNDAPGFTAGPDQTVLEDAGAQTVNGWASAISAGPADESGQVLTFNVTANDNPALFSAGPTVDPGSGDLSFTPAADANGTANITVQLMDDGGTANGGVDTSAPFSFVIEVTSVNDPPEFSAGDDQTVLEDAGPQSVNGFATGISAGPADESGQTLTFNITGNDNPALFSAGPALDDAGNLTYTPAADANGTASITVELIDDGGTANGGVDTSPAQTFAIDVTGVNDAPTFTAGPDQTVLEDAGAQTVNAWATAISAGPADESGQTLTFNVTANDNPALFSAGPALDSAGNLTYTPAADANGSADIAIELMDDGGTANGGADASAPASFTITIDPVNDAPTFTAGADVTVLEDSGAYAQSWATSIDPGAADEGGQILTFNITANDNPGLFAAGPAIDAGTGNLDFTPAAEASGVANLTLELMDDGGTANGGVDTSASVNLVITVTGVNDAPSFTAGPDQTVDEDSGAQTVNGWATGIGAGPADEAGQMLTFNVAGNSDPSLFSAGPAVDAATGDLTFTPAANAYGSATITLELMDDGGTANGGVDTSPSQDFVITINPINDPPTAPATINVDVTTHIRIDVPAVSGLLAGAADDATEAADPAGPAAPGTNLTVGNGGNPAPTSTTNGGDLTINTADGSFSYNPPAGFTGSDSFSYVVCDDGIGAPGPQCSTPVDVTLTVSGPRVWFVDNAVSGGGNDGRLATPFESLAAFNGSLLPAAGDFIFLATGSSAYSDGADSIALADNQTLFGHGTTGTTFDAFTGITPAPNSLARPTLGAARPVIEAASNGILVSTSAGNSNTLRGFDIGNTPGGMGITGTIPGTLNISEVDITGSGGLLSLDGSTTGTLNASFGTLSSASAATTWAFEVMNMAGGSLSSASTTITTPGQNAIRISGTPTMSSNFGDLATILTSNGSGIVTNNPGSVTISPPAPVTVQTVGGPALDLGGGTYTGFNFSSLSADTAVNGIVLNNTAGFISCGGGTIQNTSGDAVVITGGSNNITLGTFITNTAGRAVEVTGHTGGNVVLNQITDTAQGVFLDNNAGTSFFFAGTMNLNTGAADAFTATGGGSLDATGANNVIATTTGRAVRIDGMSFRNSDFTVRSVSANGASSGIVLNNTSGSGSFVVTGDGSTAGSGGTIQNTTGNGVQLSSTGNIELNFIDITNSNANGIFGNGVTNFVLNGANVTGNGDAVNEGGLRFDPNLLGTATITDTTITGSAEHNIEITNTSGVLNPLTVSNSTIGSNSAALGSDGLLLETRNSASATVVVTGSTFNDNRSDGIQIAAINQSSATLTVDDTTFTSTLDASPNGSVAARGIVVSASTDATLNFDIGATTSNVFENLSPAIGEEAINVTLISTSTASALLQGRVNNNTFTNSGGAVGIDVRGDGALVMEIDGNTADTSRQAIDVITGDGATDIATADLTITNNSLTVAGTTANPNNEAIGWLGDFETASCLNVRGNSGTASGTRPDFLIDDFTTAGGSLDVESGPTDCGGGACATSEAHLEGNNAITDAVSSAGLVAPGTCVTVP